MLPNGLKESVGEQYIKSQSGLKGDLRHQFMDPDFGNESNNLTSVSDVQDKGTIKVIFNSLTMSCLETINHII